MSAEPESLGTPSALPLGLSRYPTHVTWRTTSAKTDVAFVHDRMPVVLDGFAAEEALLDPDIEGRGAMAADHERWRSAPRWLAPPPKVRVGREADAGLPACRKRARGGTLNA